MAQPVQAVVFDAYGTLFDVYSVGERCEGLFPGKSSQLVQLWRSKQLEYSWLSGLMGHYQHFEAITSAALRYACTHLGLTLTPAATTELMRQYRRLTPYPEVRGALEQLRPRRLAILSNGAPAMLAAVVEHAGLHPLFDAVLSVDAVQIYKPHPSVYQHAVSSIGIEKSAVAFVSSNYWDAMGATAFGFRTFWINRAGATPDTLGFAPSAVLSDLNELTDVLT
jgi:2-haloacid dehalogenase